MVDTKDREIDGCKYTATQFPAREGLKVKAKLVKVIAPFLLPLLGGKSSTSLVNRNFSEVDIDPSLLSQAIEIIIRELHEDDIVIFVLRLLSCTRKDGKEITPELFDLEFAGEYATLYKVLSFIIEINNFFGKGGIGNLSQVLKAIPPTVPKNKK